MSNNVAPEAMVVRNVETVLIVSAVIAKVDAEKGIVTVIKRDFKVSQAS